MKEEAERLGYDSVWTAESYGSDVFTPLAWLGSHTTRIKLGTGAIILPWHDPLRVAENFHTLATLHPGRIDLGVGRARLRGARTRREHDLERARR